MLFDREADLSACWHGQCYRSALRYIATCQLDLVIIGLQIEKIAVFDLIKEIHDEDPNVPILVYGSCRGVAYTKLLAGIGIQAYVRKSEPTDILFKAIRSLVKGELCSTVRKNEKENLIEFRKLFGELPLSTLAKRELEVFRLIGEGKTSPEIATEMALAVKTVETYRSTIRRKLSLRNNVELIQVSFAWLQATMTY